MNSKYRKRVAHNIIHGRIRLACEDILGDPDSVNYFCQGYYYKSQWHLGGTYLHIAAKHNEPYIVELLIKLGANLEAKQQVTGHTPIFLAIMEQNFGIMQMLLAHGANVNHIDKTQKMCIEYALCNYTRDYLVISGLNISYINPERRSLLHSAVVDNKINQVKYLISLNKININAQDKYGWTALHHACDRTYFEIVRVLLEAGADPNIQTPYGYLPIHKAIVLGYYNKKLVTIRDIVGLLLKYNTSLYTKHCIFQLAKICKNMYTYYFLCQYETKYLIKQLYLISCNSSSNISSLPYEIIELIANQLRFLRL